MPQADFAALCELDDLEAATTTREQYVHGVCKRLLYEGDAGGVGWQLTALVAGFRLALPPRVLSPFRLTPSQLSHAVCGGQDGGQDSEQDGEAAGRDGVYYEKLREVIHKVCASGLEN